MINPDLCWKAKLLSTGLFAAGLALPGGGYSKADDILKPAINLQKQAGHIPGTAQYANRIKQGKTTLSFTGKESADKWAQKAWKEGVSSTDPNVKSYNAGVTVGFGPNGGAQKELRVSMDSKGSIHASPWGQERY